MMPLLITAAALYDWGPQYNIISTKGVPWGYAKRSRNSKQAWKRRCKRARK